MNKQDFLKAMVEAGRGAMTALLNEWFGPAGTKAAEQLTTPELAEVLWGFHCCSAAA